MIKSLGQVAYDHHRLNRMSALAPSWERMTDHGRAEWDSLAQAVVDAYLASQAEALNTKPNPAHWFMEPK